MKLRITIIFPAVAAMFLIWGCSDDKPTSNNNPGDTTSTTTTVWNTDGYWLTENLDASSSDPAIPYIYYDFAGRDTMTLTAQQAATDTVWDIAFKRSNIILNSGVSGPGSIVGVDLATLGNADSTNFLAFNDPSTISSNDWVEDHYELMVDDWYSYNPVSHSLSATGYIYIIKDAVGEYVKFKVLNLENPGMPPDMGTISIEYIYSGTSRIFSGTPDTLIFDASGEGPFYVDFSAHAITSPVDPLHSENWDILFENYEIHLNATIFGSGDAACYAVWQDQEDPTDFTETTEAPSVDQAYFSDSFASVMSNWYDYQSDTHQLPSRNHVYVINDNGHHIKLQIVSYYKSVGGNPVSGWYTFKWLALD